MKNKMLSEGLLETYIAWEENHSRYLPNQVEYLRQSAYDAVETWGIDGLRAPLEWFGSEGVRRMFPFPMFGDDDTPFK